MASYIPRSRPTETCHRKRAPWTWVTCREEFACPPAECASLWGEVHCHRTAGQFVRGRPFGSRAARHNRPPSGSARISSGKPLGDGEAPTHPERFGGDLQAGSSLLALVFV